MLKLPILQPHEIESPAQMFRCEFYKATLAAGICIARQGEPNIRGGGQEWMKRPRYEQCASGKCEQGNTIKERLGEYKPAESKRDRQRLERTVAGKAHVAAIEKRLAEHEAEGLPASEIDELDEDLARRAHAAEKPPTDEVATAVEAARAAEPKKAGSSKRSCATHDCPNEFRSTKYDKCWRCRVGLKVHLNPEDHMPPSRELRKKEPAPPAEEEKMGLKGPKSPLDNVTDEEFRKAFLEAGGKIERLRKRYGAAHSTTARRADALGLRAESAKQPRKAKKAPTLADVAKKHNGKQPFLVDAPYKGPAPLPSAPSLVGDDVVQLLEQKRQQHLDQAARIDKALSALRVG